MNVKAIVPLVAGLGIAGVAGKMGFDYLQKASAAPEKSVQVWAAAVDIPRGSSIDETMLRPLSFPASALPAGAFADKQKLLGRIPRIVAPANLPILDSMLSPPGTNPGVLVPPGLRAASVKIDESSGVDNHLTPGVRVDVIGFFRAGRGTTNTLARTIIENVEVAAVGDRISVGGTQPGDAPEKGKSKAAEKPARAVTLLVKPEDVPRLHLAEQQGKIKLAMRNTDESGQGAGGAPRPNVVTDSDVIVGPQPKNGLLAQLFDRLTGAQPGAHGPAADAHKPAPRKPEPPKPAHVMVIVNGSDRRMLAWDRMDSIQPMDYTPESPQGLFTDDAVQRTTDAPHPADTDPADAALPDSEEPQG